MKESNKTIKTEIEGNKVEQVTTMKGQSRKLQNKSSHNDLNNDDIVLTIRLIRHLSVEERSEEHNKNVNKTNVRSITLLHKCEF